MSNAQTIAFEKELEQLMAEERLQDFASLLRPRDWDEVPLVSQYAQLGFMQSLTVLEQSQMLTIVASRHLEKIVAYMTGKALSDTLVMVAIHDWDCLEEVPPYPVMANFWITTNASREVVATRWLKEATTEQARLVQTWIQDAGLSRSHVVLDRFPLDLEDGYPVRVYVAVRGSLHERYVIPT